MKKQFYMLALCALFLGACTRQSGDKIMAQDANIPRNTSPEMTEAAQKGFEVATLAGGCFWKMDAAFQQLKGVQKVVVGYAGGHVDNPTYSIVSGEESGHAETFQVVYDPKVVSYKELLHYYWFMHDPTKPNQEGNDVGPSYRSIVFYHNDQQKADAEAIKTASQSMFKAPILTEIAPYANFFRAEDYHQNYYNQNTEESYCKHVVGPKVHKFEMTFRDKLKTSL